MNVKKIKEIVNHPGYDDDIKERLILAALAEDETLIPTLLEILGVERKRKAKVLREMNFQLSRAHMTIEVPDINKEHFVEKEIVKFYRKFKDEKDVGHCFANMDNLEKYPPSNDDKPKYLGETYEE